MKKTEDEAEMRSVDHDRNTQMGQEEKCNKGPEPKAVRGVLNKGVVSCGQTSTVKEKMEPAGAVVLHNQYAPLMSCI